MKRELIFTTIAAEIVWFFVIWYSEVNMWIDQWLVIGLFMNLFWIGTLFTVISIPLFAKRAVTPKGSVTLETGQHFATAEPTYYEKDGVKKLIYPKVRFYAGGGAYLSNVYGWKGGGREGGIWIVEKSLDIDLEGNRAWNCDFDKYVGKEHRKIPIKWYNTIIRIRSNFDDKIPIMVGRGTPHTETEEKSVEIDWRMKEEFLNEKIHNRDDEIEWLHGELKTVYKRHREREEGRPRSIIDKMLKDKGERFGE